MSGNISFTHSVSKCLGTMWSLGSHHSKFKSLLKSRKIWAITVGSQLTIRGAVTLLVLGNSIFLKRLWLSKVLCHYYSGALVLLESYSRLRLAKAWLNTDFWLDKKLLTSFFSKVSNFVAFYVQRFKGRR